MKKENEQPLVTAVKQQRMMTLAPMTSPEVPESNSPDNNAFSTFRAIDLAEKDSTTGIQGSSQDTTETSESEKSALSDERCKYGKCLGENGSSLLDLVSKLDSYVYTYNDTAKSLPNAEEKGVDDAEHVGIMAQELAQNPVTAAAVKEDPLSGFLTVDTNSLTLTQQAILNEMAKRIIALEEKVNGTK